MTSVSKAIVGICNKRAWVVAVRLLALGALSFAAYVTLRYLTQPLVDLHAFRQTQTALTAYWMQEEGWSLAYQTPVAGFPWSIPYEFPIYQALVAFLSGIARFDLSPAGRLVSFLFLIGCAWPALSLCRRLDLPQSVAWVFCALLWTSPLYVYWGRTFMIETAAVFFSFASIPYAIDVIRGVGGWRSTMLFMGLASAGVLQKATTGGPVLLFLVVFAAWSSLRRYGVGTELLKRLIQPMAVLCGPLLIGLAWAHYADVVKSDNPFGVHLTSKALMDWNFGNAKQRAALETRHTIVLERALRPNAGGLAGVLLLLLPWLAGKRSRPLGTLTLAALLLFLLPIAIFINLHLVHDYYQVACVLYLIAAVSLVIGGVLKPLVKVEALVPIVTMVFMVLNITAFNAGYGVVAAGSLDELDAGSVKAYKIGRFLRDRTAPDSGLVVFGQDWSSEVGFHSERKSVTVGPEVTEYRRLWEVPESYLGGLKLSGIVVCPSPGGFPGETEVRERMLREPQWQIETIDDCTLMLNSLAVRLSAEHGADGF